MTMNPKERLLGVVADLQRFVIHHPDQARCPVCPRWDELQGAAMQAVTAIDDHKAELAALRAERDSQNALDLLRTMVGLAVKWHCEASGVKWGPDLESLTASHFDDLVADIRAATRAEG